MSLFRKQPTAAPTTGTPVAAGRDPQQVHAPPQGEPLFNGSNVDISAIYRTANLTADELDRVARAEGLLHLVPTKASHTREIVDATFRAFGVDRTKIVDAATKQLDALEEFVRFSHEQTQRVLDSGAQRIAELEAEIDSCRRSTSLATHEGEERARTVNVEMVKVQRVLEFFGDDSELDADDELDDATALTSQGTNIQGARPQPPAVAKPKQPPTS